MTRPAVVLDTQEQRRRVLDEVVASLLRHNIPVAVAALDRIHLHVLAQCLDNNPRHWTGIAKRESSHYCKITGHASVGGIWAVGCECKPIADRDHFSRTLGYIPDHGKRGAEIYRGSLSAANPLGDFNPDDLLVE
jgi:hypothetical protein